MTRRISLVLIFLVLCASTAWPKFKDEDQKYLNDQFRALQEQIQGLKTQLDTVNARLGELRQNQAQLQAVIIRQQRALQDLDQLIASVRISGEENFSNLKTILSQLRSEQQKGFSTLTGQPAQPGTTEVATPTKPTPPAPALSRVVQGYITVVESNSVMVDLGSAQGLRPGSRLAVYKATDQNVRVGVVEVTEVVDARNSRAQIVTMNAGVRPEFSDIVRLE